jgi:hypothetical protein
MAAEKGGRGQESCTATLDDRRWSILLVVCIKRNTAANTAGEIYRFLWNEHSGGSYRRLHFTVRAARSRVGARATPIDIRFRQKIAECTYAAIRAEVVFLLLLLLLLPRAFGRRRVEGDVPGRCSLGKIRAKVRIRKARSTIFSAIFQAGAYRRLNLLRDVAD